VEGRAVDVSTSGVPNEGLNVVSSSPPSQMQDPSGVVQPIVVVVEEEVKAVYSGEVEVVVVGQMQGTDVVEVDVPDVLVVTASMLFD